MPLKCVKCGALFEVRVNSDYEAHRLQDKLWNHTVGIHGGNSFDYLLVDEHGVSVETSTSERVKEEQAELDSRVKWDN